MGPEAGLLCRHPARRQRPRVTRRHAAWPPSRRIGSVTASLRTASATDARSRCGGPSGAGEPLPRGHTPPPVQDLRAAARRTRICSCREGASAAWLRSSAGCAMLKRGRSLSGIELLPAELDFAAAAEISPVDLTCAAATHDCALPLRTIAHCVCVCAGFGAAIDACPAALQRHGCARARGRELRRVAGGGDGTCKTRGCAGACCAQPPRWPRTRRRHATHAATAQALRGRRSVCTPACSALTRPRARFCASRPRPRSAKMRALPPQPRRCCCSCCC